MTRKFAVAAALAAAIGVAGAANAADLSRREVEPPVKAPIYVPPVALWTGFYAGLNLGYGWGDGSGTLAAPAIGAVPFSGSGNGIVGGGQIGYNWQTGPWVFGLEADMQGTGADGTITSPAFPGFVTNTDTPWFATFRGRIGYAFNNWLFYATGGGALVNNHISGVRPAVLGGGTFSSSETGLTWTVGGGVEVMIMPKWSVKAEYLFIDTPDSVPTIPGTAVAGSSNNHVVRAGFNYHF